MAEIHPSPLIPAQTVFFFLLGILSIGALPSSRVSILPLTPCLFSAFVPAACVSQMERLAAMAVMQNTFQMNAGLPQWKRHQRQPHKYSFYSFLGGKSCVADSKIRAEEDHFSLQGENIETVRAKGITMNIYRLTFSVKSKLDCFHLHLLAVSPHFFAQHFICKS